MRHQQIVYRTKRTPLSCSVGSVSIYSQVVLVLNGMYIDQAVTSVWTSVTSPPGLRANCKSHSPRSQPDDRKQRTYFLFSCDYELPNILRLLIVRRHGVVGSMQPKLC